MKAFVNTGAWMSRVRAREVGTGRASMSEWVQVPDTAHLIDAALNIRHTLAGTIAPLSRSASES